MATWEMFQRLPALDDDQFVGVEMEHLVPRDNQPDLRFAGTLLASAAPDFNEHIERWREYRVYRTRGGKYVFATAGRSIRDGERDRFDAKTPDDWGFESWQEQLKRHFGYDEVAKRLYDKLKVDSAEKLD